MAKFGVKEVADVTFYDLTTGKPVLFFDTLKMSNLENAAETVYATGGKGNARLITWNFGRTATMNIQDALLDPKAVAALSGNLLEEGVQSVHKREILEAVAGAVGETKVTLTETPNDPTKVFVYKVVDGDKMGQEVTPLAVTGKDVTFDEADVAVGEHVHVFYTFDTSDKAKKIVISADKFPGHFKIVGDTVVRNQATGVDEPFQLIIPKAKLQPGFTITMEAEGDPSVFDFNIEVEKDPNSTDMIIMIKY